MIGLAAALVLLHWLYVSPTGAESERLTDGSPLAIKQSLAGNESSFDREPSAGREPLTNKEPSANRRSSLDNQPVITSTINSRHAPAPISPTAQRADNTELFFYQFVLDHQLFETSNGLAINDIDFRKPHWQQASRYLRKLSTPAYFNILATLSKDEISSEELDSAKWQADSEDFQTILNTMTAREQWAFREMTIAKMQQSH